VLEEIAQSITGNEKRKSKHDTNYRSPSRSARHLRVRSTAWPSLGSPTLTQPQIRPLPITSIAHPVVPEPSQNSTRRRSRTQPISTPPLGQELRTATRSRPSWADWKAHRLTKRSQPSLRPPTGRPPASIAAHLSGGYAAWRHGLREGEPRLKFRRGESGLGQFALGHALAGGISKPLSHRD
jgi:hypothetical protein